MSGFLTGVVADHASFTFLHHRQKEKKDAGAYRQDSSAPSSTGSAPDPDHDAQDLESLPFAFSSSPAPAILHRHPSASRAPIASPSFLSRPAYTGLPVNKENLDQLGPAATPSLPALSASNDAAPFHSTRSTTAATPNAYTYTYSYPSASAAAQIPVYETDLKRGATAPHRLATTSIIAAKKHVRKRPLGSHAPMARKPSLSHEFNFPDSPPKGVKGARKPLVDERPPLRRMGSSASVGSAGSGGLFSRLEGGEGRARVWVDALEEAERPEPLPLPSALLTGELKSEGCEEDATGEDDPDASAFATTSTLPTVAEVKTPAPLALAQPAKFKTRDEVWQHMASDAPSSPTNSPAPLTRKMMLAHAAENGDHDAQANPISASSAALFPSLYATAPSSTTSISAPTRKPLTRTFSLGRVSAHSSNSNSARPSLTSHLEGSRAGGEEACAIEAFERKRARALGEAIKAGGTPVAEKKRQRTSGVGPGAKKGEGMHPVRGGTRASSKTKAQAVQRKEGGVARERRRSAPQAGVSTATHDNSFAPASPSPSSSSCTISPSGGDHLSLSQDDAISSSSMSEMGDLSFSSTSTATSATVGTPTNERGSFFALTNAVKVTAAAHAREGSKIAVAGGDRDEEQECAELLLGLGGFF